MGDFIEERSVIASNFNYIICIMLIQHQKMSLYTAIKIISRKKLVNIYCLLTIINNISNNGRRIVPVF